MKIQSITSDALMVFKDRGPTHRIAIGDRVWGSREDEHAVSSIKEHYRYGDMARVPTVVVRVDGDEKVFLEMDMGHVIVEYDAVEAQFRDDDDLPF